MPRLRAAARAAAVGQGLVEYTLILSLIAIVAIVSLVVFGDAIAAMLQLIGDEIDKAA